MAGCYWLKFYEIRRERSRAGKSYSEYGAMMPEDSKGDHNVKTK